MKTHIANAIREYHQRKGWARKLFTDCSEEMAALIRFSRHIVGGFLSPSQMLELQSILDSKLKRGNDHTLTYKIFMNLQQDFNNYRPIKLIKQSVREAAIDKARSSCEQKSAKPGVV